MKFRYVVALPPPAGDILQSFLAKNKIPYNYQIFSSTSNYELAIIKQSDCALRCIVNLTIRRFFVEKNPPLSLEFINIRGIKSA